MQKKISIPGITVLSERSVREMSFLDLALILSCLLGNAYIWTIQYRVSVFCEDFFSKSDWVIVHFLLIAVAVLTLTAFVFSINLFASKHTELDLKVEDADSFRMLKQHFKILERKGSTYTVRPRNEIIE